MLETQNKDAGSLKVGDIDVWEGDFLIIEGEKHPRRITCVMGSGSNKSVCCKGSGAMPTGDVTWNTIRIIGADPAPKGGIDYYDGTAFGHVDADADCRAEFERITGRKGITLIAWDAPISFDKKHGFYSRPVDDDSKNEDGNFSPLRSWVEQHTVNENGKNGKIAKGAVNTRPFCGCPHWAITCECLGMPYGIPLTNSWIACDKKDILQKNPNSFNRPVIEVHPAVSMAVWWVTRKLNNTPFPKYKGSKKQKDAVIIIREALQKAGLISDGVEESIENDVWNDNQLDAWVAWKMGVDFLTGDAIWVGSPHEGGFVLPKEAASEFKPETK